MKYNAMVSAHGKLHISINETQTLCGMTIIKLVSAPDKYRAKCGNCIMYSEENHPSQIAARKKEARAKMIDKLPYDPDKFTVTINTDASLSGDGTIAAGAWWIKSNHFNLKVWDSALLDHCANSSVAELRAFDRAIDIVNEAVGKFPRDRVRIYINIDSMWLIQALRGLVRKSAYSHLSTPVVKKVEGYELDIRHVKAHTSDLSTKRSWVNDWCDAAARDLVRAEIKHRREAHATDRRPV